MSADDTIRRVGRVTASLSEPLRLQCGQVLPNRVMKAALSEGLATDSHGPDIRLERLYSQWGEGGYGLVVTGNVMVDRLHLGEPGNVVIEDDRHLDGLSRWAKTTQDGGSPIWMQVNHPGRQANPLATRSRPVAPSAVALNIPGLPTPRALTDAEIHDIIGRFAEVATVAETAGFNGVQIHGAHGYLVSQFLSPLANRRTDRWGGSPDARMRFVLEVVRAIRGAVSPGFAVGIKLNSADFQKGGFSEDESRTTIEALVGEKIDLIEISGGSYESPAMMGRSDAAMSESTKRREAYFLEYAHTVRSAAGDVPLAVTGGFRSQVAMAAALASGDCDVVGLGRPTVISTSAAQSVTDGTGRLDAPRISLGLPARLAKTSALRSLDGALDLQWHTDQIHLIAGGGEPDPGRSPWRTAGTILRRNGLDAFTSRRGVGTSAADDAALRRKFRRERAIGRYVANPAMRGLTAAGVRTSLMTDIETTGRKTGVRRRVPVSVSFDDTGAWIISQHGTRSGWGANITADPVVRVRQGSRWRTATAAFVADDDVIARARSFADNPVLGRIIGSTFRALQTTPISVRLTFTDDGSQRS